MKENDREKQPPNIDRAKFAQAFIIETIYLSNLSAFVVAANQCNPVGIAHLNQNKVQYINIKKHPQNIEEIQTLSANKRRKVSTE